MDGTSAKKSTSFETLVIQSLNNINDLKSKLNEIIKTGKDYKYDVSNCLKALIRSSDQDIVLLSVQAISELAKCNIKRQTFSDPDFIIPILETLSKDFSSDKKELWKQTCRALGNLCCDCDTARKGILDNNGVQILGQLLEKTIHCNTSELDEIKMLVCKTFLNFSIGGGEFTKALTDKLILESLNQILDAEMQKKDMNDDLVTTILLVFSVVIENIPEYLFTEDLNRTVLGILKVTSDIEISELCLEHLHTQAEHDSVKNLLAKEGGAHLVCTRLKELIQLHEAEELNADECEVDAVIKKACDLLIIILTGDEAMHMLYNNGLGDVYLTMVKWLDSSNYHLLSTAVLAIGNFARQDDYCTQMMEDKIFDKLLDIFQIYHGFSVRMHKEPDKTYPISPNTVTKIEHAVLSALRNLTVPVNNKTVAAAQGKAAPLLLKALPEVEDHHVAYKLLAVIRMLVDGQDGVARAVCSDCDVLCAAARWAKAREHAGAGSEAPRMLAWTVRQVRSGALLSNLLQVEDCLSSLVNMLLSSHSVMQNEAILALTLLAIGSLKEDSTENYTENVFTINVIKSEIGKHVSVLIETNCAKLPIEVVENLLAFLDITCKRNEIALDYKDAKVHESLHKFCQARNDLNDDMRCCIKNICKIISGNDILTE